MSSLQWVTSHLHLSHGLHSLSMSVLQTHNFSWYVWFKLFSFIVSVVDGCAFFCCLLNMFCNYEEQLKEFEKKKKEAEGIPHRCCGGLRNCPRSDNLEAKEAVLFSASANFQAFNTMHIYKIYLQRFNNYLQLRNTGIPLNCSWTHPGMKPRRGQQPPISPPCSEKTENIATFDYSTKVSAEISAEESRSKWCRRQKSEEEKDGL